jgi:hypothetical protein
MQDPTPTTARTDRPRHRRATTVTATLAVATAAVALPLAWLATPRAQSGTADATALAARAQAAAGVYERFGGGGEARAAITSAAAAAATPGGGGPGSNAGGGGSKNLPWRVGFAKESLDPQSLVNFHLGGYGILPTRTTTGPLIDGDGTQEDIFARAMAVSDKQGNTLLLGALENQGTFTADKQCACGIWDIRQQVSKDTGVPVDMIVVNSDHSHAGPDLIGLWGGVPVDYLRLVYAQTVKALDEAYTRRVPAQLLVGSDTPIMRDDATHTEPLVHSQFGLDAQTNYNDSAVDTELRVLQAVDGDGNMLGTLINYAAHATVMGSGNVRYSADWPGRVARATETALAEPVAVTMVADVGRSQPPRPTTNPNCDQPGQESCDVDKLDTYTRLLTPWVVEAVATAVPVKGHGIAGREVMTREEAVNGALLGVTYTGEVPVRGYGAYRASTPPWVTGSVIGTFASAHRIGDVLLTASPGEAYPDIRFGVMQSVLGEQAFFTFGLANDQLGYLIAPTSEYGFITTSNPGNDNSFFNVAPQYGDHLMCSQTAAAEALGFKATGNAAPYGPNAPAPNCTALTASDLLPTGPTPQQSWPFGDGTALPSPFPQ